MLPLETERLIVRSFEEPDRALFHEINSDETVMEFYPYRRTRAQSDELFDKGRIALAETGYGHTAVEIKATGECIGCCNLAILGWRSRTRNPCLAGWEECGRRIKCAVAEFSALPTSLGAGKVNLAGWLLRDIELSQILSRCIDLNRCSRKGDNISWKNSSKKSARG
jgi:Acetyltransferase (GNAT) domain